MTALLDFEFRDWTVRTLIDDDGEPWFVAADVCKALGFGNSRQALATHVTDQHRGVHGVDTPGGQQQMALVDEAGLYALAFGSRIETAAAFREWVTADVLPALRRRGSYTIGGATGAPPAAMPTHAEALRGWADAIEETERLQAQVDELEPAARFSTQLAHAAGDYSVREAAQILDRDPTISTGEQRLFRTLKALGWIDRTNAPYQRHVDCGRLVRKIGHYRDPATGEMVAYAQVRITPKGLRELHRLMGGVTQLMLVAGVS